MVGCCPAEVSDQEAVAQLRDEYEAGLRLPAVVRMTTATDTAAERHVSFESRQAT